MEKFYYLAILIFSICGLLLADYRLRLAFFYDRLRAAKTISLAVLFFIVWDLLGIGVGIFFTGNSKYDLGLLLAPNFPIEELFFLFLLTYLTLVLWRLGERYVKLRDS